MAAGNSGAGGRHWWKEGVVYQVYPRSFRDSDGDGIGDLRGVASRLGYLESLGVDVLWLCPTYASPNDDNGYDISDYRSVAAEFGTLEDMDALIAEARRRGIRVVLDLVVNHTSDEHPWFVESRASRDSPKRDWYVWKRGRDGGPPTAWPSIFGGPAWELDPATGEYYLHTFSRKQPDLNWENPDVREAVYEMMEWWVERGIAGFRVDAITFIKKDPAWPETVARPPHVPCNEPGVLDFLREMRDRVIAPHDMVTVAEAPNVARDQMEDYIGEGRGVFSMIFTFEHVDIDSRSGMKWRYGPWTRLEWKRTFSSWQEAIGDTGWLGLYLENHDQVRAVSKFGDSGEFRAASARTLATWYFLMRGTPFIYQGQEIGMTNCPFAGIGEYRDVSAKQMYLEERAAGRPDADIMDYLARRGRDHARTPMQWDSSPQAGFTTGVPWIRVHPEYPAVNVAAQDGDPGSVLNHYRALVRLRRSEPALVYGAWEELYSESEALGGYRRTLDGRRIAVACNFTRGRVALPGGLAGRVLLDGGEGFDGVSLGPWQSVVVAEPDPLSRPASP